MNENLYIAHKKLPHKTLRVHIARYTQCIHVRYRKLKLPKDTHTKKYKQLLPTNPFPKVELYIAVRCKMASTSAIWQQAEHTTYQLSSPSCLTGAIQKSLTLNKKY